MSEPFSFSTATSLTSTGTSDVEVDAASESLPNAADASPKFCRVFTLHFPKKVPETSGIPQLKLKQRVFSDKVKIFYP
jgi:hypothetical protein